MQQGTGSIMGGILVMQAVTGEVEYIFPEKDFGSYPEAQEVCSAAAVFVVPAALAGSQVDDVFGRRY